MLLSEFRDIQATYACVWCKTVGAVDVSPHPSDGTHPGKLVCRSCDRFLMWLTKDKNADERPTIKARVRDAVWAEYGNRCAHCGASAEDLAYLGVMRTVQHAPPYADVQNGGKLIPYCDWCQQRATSEMKRLHSLLERLRRKDR